MENYNVYIYSDDEIICLPVCAESRLKAIETTIRHLTAINRRIEDVYKIECYVNY